MKHKIYPSASAFMWGDVVLTDYDSGCLRSILIKSHTPRTEIPKLYQEVGAVHETKYEGEVKDHLLFREQPIKAEILTDVEYSGRCDFILDYGLPIVDECKATVSQSGVRGLREGKYKLSHLAQLVSYLCKLKIPRGRLIYGYYERTAHDWVEVERYVFKVSIADSGAVFINGVDSGFHVNDQLRHLFQVAKHLKEQKIGPRPWGWESKWGSPCNLCPFQATCASYDNGEIESLDEVVASATQELKTHTPFQPKIKWRKS